MYGVMAGEIAELLQRLLVRGSYEEEDQKPKTYVGTPAPEAPAAPVPAAPPAGAEVVGAGLTVMVDK